MTEEEKAYVAGFLDGDGSIMAQIVRRKDYRLGFQIRMSIVFYQKSKHESILHWLKQKLKHGYIRKRSDGMSEYSIVGFREVENVLRLLHPFLHLKKDLAKQVLGIINDYPDKMTPNKFLRFCERVDQTAKFNYSKSRTNTTDVVTKYFKDQNLSP